VQDWLCSGEAALTNVAIQLVERVEELTKSIENAIRKAIRAGRGSLQQLLQYPIFPVVKSLGPTIYSFNVRALAGNPAWFVLNYLGPNTAQADRNRTSVDLRWGHLRINSQPGEQLDEFPYASTVQGGIGALGRMVPWLENAIQGGMLQALYRYSMKNRPGHFIVAPLNL
jgi:hypothetical protein